MSASGNAAGDLHDLLGDFLDESSQLIASLNDDLLTLEQLVRGALQAPGDGDLMNRMFRSAHSIKGLSAMLGLPNINGLTHNIEHVFDAARRNELQFDAHSVETVLQAVDRLALMIDRLKDAGVDDLPTDETVAALGAVLAQPQSPQSDDPFAGLEDEQAPDKYLTLFLDEAETSLDLLTEGLMRGEGGQQAVDWETLLVTAHRVKGSAAAVGLHRGAKLAHLMEDLLQELRRAHAPLTPETADALLHAADALRSYAQGLKAGVRDSAGFANCARELQRVSPRAAGNANVWSADHAVASPPPAPARAAAQDAAPPNREQATANDDAPAARPVVTMRVDMERLDQLMNLSGQLAIGRAGFTRIAQQLRSAAPGRHAARRAAEARRTLQNLLAKDSPLDPAGLRADLERVCRDLELLGHELDRQTHAQRSVNELSEAIHQLDRVAVQLQKTVMDTRLAPIGPLLNRFKRVIRDMTRKADKDVRLEIRGEKTELDKRMIDELSDPLIHMVRNSLDHGIETRAERLQRGKPAQGVLRLTARRRGNSILIDVSDDGRGLDRATILQRAVERGLVTPLEAESMTDQQAHQLIWRPGFSTAPEVTSTSGRGVGMDIVRAKVEELHGAIDIVSRPGQGTTFTIRLPLTLAILPSLLAEIDGDVFALPIESVIEIAKARPADLRTVLGSPVAQVRGRPVPLTSLNQLLRQAAGEPPQAPSRPEPAAGLLVVVGAQGREVGIPVDALLGEQDVLIKSLSENYGHVPGISGVTILGDGRVALILDPAPLIENACPAPETNLEAATTMRRLGSESTTDHLTAS